MPLLIALTIYFLLGIAEMDSVTSGMILITWTWLFTLLSKSGVLTEEEAREMQTGMKKRMRLYVEDHHLISWVLDHRLLGVGLTGMATRRIREIAVQLFVKLYPDADTQAFSKQWIQFEKKDGICFFMFILCLLILHMFYS